MLLLSADSTLAGIVGVLEQQATAALTRADADLTSLQYGLVNFNTYGTSASGALLGQLDTTVADLRNLTAAVKLLANLALPSQDQTDIASAGLDFYNRYVLFYQSVPLNSSLLAETPGLSSGLNAIQATVIEGINYTTSLVPDSETAQFKSILSTLRSEAANLTSVLQGYISSSQSMLTTATSTTAGSFESPRSTALVGPTSVSTVSPSSVFSTSPSPLSQISSTTQSKAQSSITNASRSVVAVFETGTTSTERTSTASPATSDTATPFSKSSTQQSLATRWDVPLLSTVLFIAGALLVG